MKKGIVFLIVILFTVILMNVDENKVIAASNKVLLSNDIYELKDAGHSLLVVSTTDPSMRIKIHGTPNLAILRILSEFITQVVFVFMIAGVTGVFFGVKIAKLITSIIDWDY